MKVPEITYPLSLNTVGALLATGSGIIVYCDECGRYRNLNLVTLARRFGMGFNTMHDSLIRVIYCAECKDAGRPSKNLHFSAQKSGPYCDIETRRLWT